MLFHLERVKKIYKASHINNEAGYILIIVTLIGLVLAFIFGTILPQLHRGQYIRAINNLNEQRAYEAAMKGINAVKLGLTNLTTFQDLIADKTNSKGIAQAIFNLCGVDSDTGTWTNHDIYRNDDGDIQFISGCQGINVSTLSLPNEYGMLQIAIIVSSGGNLDWSFYDSREKSTDTVDDPWLTQTNPSGIIWNNYDDFDGSASVRFCDFDYEGQISATYPVSPSIPIGPADFKYLYTFSGSYTVSSTWNFTIGNNGTWRGKTGITDLWNLVLKIPDTTTTPKVRRPFYGKNNDGDVDIDPGDGSLDSDDVMDVFIIIRSTGITVAPTEDYDINTNTTAFNLVNEANSHLPNPIRQVLEAGFYLVETEDSPGSGTYTFTVRQFYFAQVHNLKVKED